MVVRPRDRGKPSADRLVPAVGRTVSVRGDVVMKVQDPETSRKERLRAEAGRAVSLETELFVVPAIVSFDDPRGEIVFERLHPTPLPLLEASSDGGRILALVGRAAGVLAAIHRHMQADDGAAEVAAGSLGVAAARTQVALHGDFALRNVLYLPASDRIAVIDWSNAAWVGVDADRGPPELDVAVFLMSLFHRRIFNAHSIPHRHELARHFLATYASTSPHGVDVDVLRAIVAATTPALNAYVRRGKGAVRALGYRHSMIDLDRFLCRLGGQALSGGAGAAESQTKAMTMERSRSSMRYTDRHKARGDDYHATFSPEVNPYRAMVWRLEQQVLDAIVHEHLVPGRIAHLDFACGTGRILGHLSPHVASATGVDVSSSMLDVARKVAPGAEVIEADLTERDVLGDRHFDLVTAFRFFPNAEPELRRAVFAALARHLAPGGVLVFNNHKNGNSLRRRISRLLRREVARGTMTHAAVEALVAGAGLRLLAAIPLASLPVSENHLLLPVPLLEPVERWLSGRPWLTPIAQDIIYVCGRGAPNGHPQSNSSPSHR